jgi:hypothetical protein
VRQKHTLSGLHWLLGGIAAVVLAAEAPAVEPVGRAVHTQTIIVPADEAEGGGSQPSPAEDELPPGIAQPPLSEIPTVEYDVAKLPTPVRRLRDQIIEAASTGDPEKLRPIIDANGEPPMFSFGDVPDPIEYLKSLSGDPEGREILAVLIEVFEAGYVHVDVGTPDEMYVWPYFARYPVDALTPRQLVELFKLVYAGDYVDMQVYGHYTSYRAGIAPDGTWRYFIAD